MVQRQVVPFSSYYYYYFNFKINFVITAIRPSRQPVPGGVILVLVQQKFVPKERHSKHAIITQKCTACRVLLLNYPSYLLSTLFLLYLVWCLFILFNFPQLPSLPALRLWELKTFFPFILLPWGSSCLVTTDRSHEGLRAQQPLRAFPTFKYLGTNSTSCNITTLAFHQMWMWSFGFMPSEYNWLWPSSWEEPLLKEREMNPKKPNMQEPKILYETVARSSSPRCPGVGLEGHVQNYKTTT